jgi:MFS family permease
MQTTGTQRRPRLQMFTALRHSSFRRFWMGMVASVLGFQIMTVAQGWLIYDLTDSKLALGYVGLAAGLPAIALNLFGGVIADKVNQRRLLIVTQVISSMGMLALATLTLTGLVEPWHIIASAFLIGSVQAFDTPTRQSLFPHLIDREDMLNAVALNSMVWQGTRVIGPAIGGIIIGTRLGVAPGFFAPFLGFLIMAVMIATLRLPPIQRAKGASLFHDMAQGINFVRTNTIFAFLISMTFFNSIFGMSYIFILPVFARDIFNVGELGLGVLHAASGAGALLGTLITASLGNFQRKGWLILGGAVLFGTFLILFAVTGSLFKFFPLSLVFIFCAGMSTSIYMITIMSTLQMMVPNELRGRVMGIYGMTWSLLPVGAMQSGAVAEYTSAPLAVAIGGAAVIFFAIVMGLSIRQVRTLSPQS